MLKVSYSLKYTYHAFLGWTLLSCSKSFHSLYNFSNSDLTSTEGLGFNFLEIESFLTPTL